MPPRDPLDLFDSVRDGLSQLLGDRTRSPEEKLIARAKAKRRRWVRHKRVYLVAAAGLISLNVVIALSTGIAFPWSAFPLIGWGMGFLLHGLSHRGWMRENERALHEAEMKLGLLPSASAPRIRASPDLVVKGVPVDDPIWRRLIEDGRKAVSRAREVIAASASHAVGAVELESSLREGLESVERLAVGAARIRGALLEIAPQGLDGLAREIARLDALIASRGHDDVEKAYLENRALLISRSAKVRALEAEAERMRVSGEGFLLAAENLRLDLARAEASDVRLATMMAEPVERLEREVAVLQRVEAELARL